MKLLPVPITPTSVKELLDAQRTAPVNMQAAAANAASVFFGNKSSQPFFLKSGASVEIPEANTRDIYIVGTAGDFIAIGIF